LSRELNSIDTFQGTAMAKFTLDQLKAKKVAIRPDVKSGYSIIKAEHTMFWGCPVGLTAA